MVDTPTLMDYAKDAPYQERIARLVKERDTLRTDLAHVSDTLLTLRERLAVFERVTAAPSDASPWMLPPTRKGHLHKAIPTLLLSDCHFDENVNPDEIEGMNAFSRDIGVKRLQRVLDKVVYLTRDFYHGFSYDGCVLLLGGDMLSGAIHEELEQTNADTIYGSLDFWAGQLAGFIHGLHSHFKRVHVYAVVGNHGRRTRKPRAKLRVKDNLDWLLYRTVAKATPKSVLWTIPESSDCDVVLYRTRYRLTHGDQFRGGSGIAGMLSPLLLGAHRKAKRQMHLGRPFDHLVMGHWHELFQGRGLIVNSSLKGFDEFAYQNNFGMEPAQQAFWLTTPEHGLSFWSPLLVEDRKAEGW